MTTATKTAKTDLRHLAQSYLDNFKPENQPDLSKIFSISDVEQLIEMRKQSTTGSGEEMLIENRMGAVAKEISDPNVLVRLRQNVTRASMAENEIEDRMAIVGCSVSDIKVIFRLLRNVSSHSNAKMILQNTLVSVVQSTNDENTMAELLKMGNDGNLPRCLTDHVKRMAKRLIRD